MARKRYRKKYSVSKLEKEILSLLENRGYEVSTQFRIVGVPFIYDFIFPLENKILEVQGNYWHCNPNQYKKGSLIKMRGFKEKILVDYIWLKDELKAQMAREQGFTVCYLWESDYKERGWAAVLEAISDS
jgi:G:T-mismatch repair DNA endonuclease (very short patch repair protein)